ncbi:MAG: FAD-dependent monooxygenase, partial [Nocardiopsaceae bacterium]|nr:FAD-dependent monooxygenase [Nocardiopsaceae bacterium]
MDMLTGDEVVIVGAGPGGLCLAGELALAGIRCVALERRTEGTKESRALALQARTLELLALRGLDRPFLERGNPVDHFRLALGSARIDLDGLDTDYRQVNICPQHFIEHVLETRAVANGARVERGTEVLGVRDAGDHVVVRFRDADGTRERSAAWVVGCDGTNSVTRNSAGIQFPGHPYPYHVVFADARLKRTPGHGVYLHVSNAGLGVSFSFGDGYWRIGSLERLPLKTPGRVPLEEVAAALQRVFGQDVGPHDPLWTSRAIFRVGNASSYRLGRIMVLGDAAHVQSPLGGQGLNLALQDAMNLGWKLAAVMKGEAADDLLDTYDAERRSVARMVLGGTDFATRFLMSAGRPQRVLRRVAIPLVLSVPVLHALTAEYVSGLRFSYSAPDAGNSAVKSHRGLRVPNIKLCDRENAATFALHGLFRTGKFVLIDQGDGVLSK